MRAEKGSTVRPASVFLLLFLNSFFFYLETSSNKIPWTPISSGSTSSSSSSSSSASSSSSSNINNNNNNNNMTNGNQNGSNGINSGSHSPECMFFFI